MKPGEVALTDQGISSNIILGFDKSTTNDVLGIDKRFRPELLITIGYSRLPNQNQAIAYQWMKSSNDAN